MIDTHSHILPGIDDGPPDLDAAVAMARFAAEAGTTVLVATPHIDYLYGVDPEVVGPAVAALQGAIDEARVPLRVEAGGEVDLGRARELDDDQLALVRLGGGPYLLLECPFAGIPGTLEAVVFELQSRRHRVVLAHPERCPELQRSPDALARLVERGALSQVTSGSLTGRFGGTVQRFAIRILRDGLVHAIASDAHDATRRRPGLGPALDEAERRIPGLGVQRDWLTRGVPAAVLAGERLPERPVLPEPASWRRRLLGRRGR